MANERKFSLPDRWSGKELSPALLDTSFGWENINFWTVWQGPVWVGSRRGDWSQGKDSEQGWPLVTGEELAIGFAMKREEKLKVTLRFRRWINEQFQTQKRSRGGRADLAGREENSWFCPSVCNSTSDAKCGEILSPQRTPSALDSRSSNTPGDFLKPWAKLGLMTHSLIIARVWEYGF